VTANGARYGSFSDLTIVGAEDLPTQLEVAAAQMREAFARRPDLARAELAQATLRVMMRHDLREGATHRLDWTFELHPTGVDG
jgi:hypothetical protein